jgi:hypothetical protein
VLRKAKAAPHTYGTRYVERVAEELGCGARVLYQHLAVAECWSAESLTAELARTNRFGHALSWSHLVALTRAGDAASRAALLENCLERCWSVRELERQIDARLASSADRQDAARSGEGVRAALRESIQTGSRAVSDLRMTSDALAERLADFDALRDDDLLQHAFRTYEELQAHAEAMLGHLRTATGSHVRIRCAPASPPDEDAEEDALAVDEDAPAPARSLLGLRSRVP